MADSQENKQKEQNDVSEKNFMIEKIKERPVNKKTLLRRTLITVSMAVSFGLLACFTFLVLEPVISNWWYPEEEPQVVVFPEDQDEMSPEQMLAENMQQENQNSQSSSVPGEIMEQEQIRELLSGIILDLDNYKQILEPVYLQTFTGSFRLAITSTLIICLVGYPFGYFMAKLSEGKKKLAMLFLMLPFWVNSLIRLYGWIIILQKKGLLNYLLMKFGIIQEPLKILYSYPAIVIGMIYVLLPFMALSVYSSAEKLDWSLVEAARDLGASRWKAFWSVTFKLTLPGLLSGVILTFIPSMGLFFIADILGVNKIVLVGSLIQEQMTRGNNWPFAAALAVVLMILTTLMIVLNRKITNVKELEGIG